MSALLRNAQRVATRGIAYKNATRQVGVVHRQLCTSSTEKKTETPAASSSSTSDSSSSGGGGNNGLLLLLAAGAVGVGGYLYMKKGSGGGCDPKGVESEEFKYKGETRPVFPAGTKSLLSKYLNEAVWKQLKEVKDSSGFSFRQAINSGIVNPDSGIGVYAGSTDSYRAFAPLMDKIIEDYHDGHGPQAKHPTSMNVKDIDDVEDPDPEGKYILSTRIRVGRNLAAYPLGSAISKQGRKEVEKAVTTAFNTFKGDLKGKYFSLGSMSAADQKQLIQDHFLFKEGDRFLKQAALNRDWPDGRGIFHNDEKTFLVWVNEEDQLRIISMEKGANIKRIFERLARATAEIEKQAKFSYTPHLGYITSCPTNLGTGLRASVMIKLPKLAKKRELLNKIADKHHVQIRGQHGEHSDDSSGIFDISNKRRLGFTETHLVRDVYDAAKVLIAEEKKL